MRSAGLHRLGPALLVAAVLAASTSPAARADDLDAAVSDDQKAYLITVGAVERRAEQNAAIPLEQRLVDYQRAPNCQNPDGTWIRGSGDGTCPHGEGTPNAPVLCAGPGQSVVWPMWRRERTTPATPWGPWTRLDFGGCSTDLLPTLTEADFRRLPLPAPTLTLQPDRGWVLINIATIVTTDPDPITLRTDLLGHGITVEATPTTWTYDFGDGHTLTTRSPGHPYPHHDVFHEYETPGTTTITLTATWTGRYLIDGTTTWHTINGTATTTTTSTPLTIEERTSHLVATHCNTRPKPADC
ncbi:hypothetical protein [Cellulomonas sp. HD19AZ1]|uniref:PKD domain-containing protein n=1 Tax=Cellulomonas sp. HD19AZ1 TaxID=2559593 RepID=UPI0010711A1C|nr:hypothetical protein [Cellulomonas sp. HD19AZ1]TFH72167.1 hypothetical protein E4A51_08690 [Cellulomonas sp. HD19AZ1]